jgi:hypothetical protein
VRTIAPRESLQQYDVGGLVVHDKDTGARRIQFVTFVRARHDHVQHHNGECRKVCGERAAAAAWGAEPSRMTGMVRALLGFGNTAGPGIHRCSARTGTSENVRPMIPDEDSGFSLD